MTISSSGPISISNIATEYDLSLNELDFDRLSKIARLPASRDIGSFRGTSSNNFTGNAGYYQRVTGVSSADSAALDAAGGAAAVRVLVNMSDATTGVIFETGGATNGFVLYVHSGIIYAQYGDGDVVGGDYEVSYTVPSTWTTDDTHEIVVSCDSRGYGLARMYIDGILVSTEYNATPNQLNDVSGSSAGGSGQVYNTLAYTRMNPTNDSSDGAFPFTGGTIRSVSTYKAVTAVPLVDSSVFGSSTYTSGVASATNILTDQSRCTILTNVTIDKDRTGIIYESGGSGVGLALYVHGGKLYIEGGAGGVVGGNVSTNWTIPDYFSTNDRTEIIASVEIISTGSSAKLFVNNREVTSNKAAGSGEEISGGDGGGTGQVYGALRFTQLNPTDDSSDGSLQYTGTIYDTQVYSGIFHPYADGGTITYATIGGVTYRIHAFTATGTSTLLLPETVECDVLLVAGGGGGGGSGGSGASGAGGGAGGLILDLNKTVSPGSYSIVVGGQGLSVNPGFDLQGSDGGDTSAFSLTAVGGGGGGSRNTGNANGRDGGSGGGEGSHGVTTSYGSGTSGQGNRGGLNGFSGSTGAQNASGGGGGAGGVGGDGLDNNYSGDGGVGLDMSAYFTTSFGENGYFAGGGGGGRAGTVTNSFGSGGIGGGADGGNTEGQSATANTGGGGGGAGGSDRAGKGGSGIVLIRYRV